MSAPSTPTTLMPVLSVKNLTISYKANRGMVQAVRDITFDVRKGETLALIGESGSGKTTVSLGLVQLLPGNAQITQGSILYHRIDRKNNTISEVEVTGLTGNRLRHFRWSEVAMVFQAALNAFNPVLRISDQFADTSRAHGYLQGRALEDRAKKLFNLVRLDPERVWRAYPHELSGGMRQRVLIALSLLLDPQVLILDEPTTALDILTQRNIMDVLKDLLEKLNFSLVFISHDLSLAAELADRVATMYAGRIVEMGDVYTIFNKPTHPYTIGLIHAVPTLTGHRDTVSSIPGSPPDLIDLPSGCKFHPRCPLADNKCRTDDPPLLEVAPGHTSACWHWKTAAESLKGGWKS
jgi:peptide/nickel transport system ATP-binding protein